MQQYGSVGLYNNMILFISLIYFTIASLIQNQWQSLISISHILVIFMLKFEVYDL